MASVSTSFKLSSNSQTSWQIRTASVVEPSTKSQFFSLTKPSKQTTSQIKTESAVSPSSSRNSLRDRCFSTKGSSISGSGYWSADTQASATSSRKVTWEHLRKFIKNTIQIYLVTSKFSCSWPIMLFRRRERTMASLRKVTSYLSPHSSNTSLDCLRDPIKRQNR